ncbi:DEHA2C04840p [Debaryomyces hansenii CBS767]|uniref:DEHA2C04840p n=1 Tax=Debaryomyces hansenii (strain ATCC 36239 / CBS 767 / BCRC 21394 / JCM 1990 / NBRC 0083 / IGC 2968) TaxID=284592 RepID=Q6BV72_DEBHA|nr:DEHA2C04840p [Debaryomyces hansenii CBS767]CAG85947.2 DEHA2C04840p [Debaryomyces hansenii CBS767]|eukprot:XP_457897.2 DEHA2C04840p [Debaryomyces hansenii CBS767]
MHRSYNVYVYRWECPFLIISFNCNIKYVCGYPYSLVMLFSFQTNYSLISDVYVLFLYSCNSQIAVLGDNVAAKYENFVNIQQKLQKKVNIHDTINTLPTNIDSYILNCLILSLLQPTLITPEIRTCIFLLFLCPSSHKVLSGFSRKRSPAL